MEDERFKGVVVWLKEYKLNPKFLEWVKENDPEWYKELEPKLRIEKT
jgi:DNA-directed RNA polymerase subunit H (RpoH/RPB5)